MFLPSTHAAPHPPRRTALRALFDLHGQLAAHPGAAAAAAEPPLESAPRDPELRRPACRLMHIIHSPPACEPPPPPVHHRPTSNVARRGLRAPGAVSGCFASPLHVTWAHADGRWTAKQCGTRASPLACNLERRGGVDSAGCADPCCEFDLASPLRRSAARCSVGAASALHC